jgi:hypothetical protein
MKNTLRFRFSFLICEGSSRRRSTTVSAESGKVFGEFFWLPFPQLNSFHHRNNSSSSDTIEINENKNEHEN